MKTILLVEDNPDDEELTILAFRRNKVENEIVVAHDGEEALRLLLGTGEGEVDGGLIARTSVVLLDLNLPKINGLEVLRRIRADERTKTLPVVILTSSKEEQDVRAGYDLGCNSYVRKPVDFTEFVEAARLLGLYWLLTNETPRRSKDG